MPPRKATKKTTSRYIEEEADENEISSGSSSTSEATSQITIRVEEEEENEEDEDETVGQVVKKRKSRTEAGTSKAEMKKWRRLAIEEKEAITNEGGIVWRAAQPLLASLANAKEKKVASDVIRNILDNIEQRLDKMVVPRTTSMPHASRNLAGTSTSSSGSMLGSVMSWQVERGGKILDEDDEEEDKEQGGVSLLQLGGFSSDIALLETLLLPEATETVAMTRAVEEQERELESSRAHLVEMKADRERRGDKGSNAGIDLQARLQRARDVLQNTGATLLNRAESMAIQETASIS